MAHTGKMSQRRRLTYLLALNLFMIAGLIGAGLQSHSLSLIAAGGDFAADAFSIGLGLLAVYLRDSHGHHRATTYVALINGTLLLVVSVFVIAEAILRLLNHSPEVLGWPMLIASALSAIIMVLGVMILGTESGKEDLHMRSVLLDTVSDGLSAIAVAAVGLVILLTHRFYWLDSVAAIAVSVIMLGATCKLLLDVYTSLHDKHAA